MIHVIQGYDRERNAGMIDEMHLLRGDVFGGRLDWDVNLFNGREIDPFDAMDPCYLVAVDDVTGRVNGALRLLPTTGPTMLRHVFDELLEDGDDVRCPTIWESTRFCVRLDAAATRSGNRLNYTTGELLAGIVEIGQLSGLTKVVSVYDARMRRVLRNAGCPADEIGSPTRIGGVTTYAGLFDIDNAMLNRIREAAGIQGSVLANLEEQPLAA